MHAGNPVGAIPKFQYRFAPETNLLSHIPNQGLNLNMGCVRAPKAFGGGPVELVVNSDGRKPDPCRAGGTPKK
ncbi:hypothetical protein B7P33_15370 [Sediminicola luteus]|uniref:Uncharacterized protein n=1 Tax=Sediminicola luteus TaxID=319238 RepID=A0A2A4G6J0_9FLAO|nr:hypothetical protein B7P33_15370 [Sediminicola luteus]